MKLITKEVQNKLDANMKKEQDERQPVVKFFDPTGSATWWISEKDGDILYGIADLGLGFREFGTVSLRELETVKCNFGLGIERDMHWKPRADEFEKLVAEGAM